MIRSAKTHGSVNDHFFQELIENSSLGVSISNIEGEVMYCNPALHRMHGYSRDEFSAKNFFEITYSEDVAKIKQLVKEIIAEKKEYLQLEKRNIRQDDSIIWVRLNSHVLYNSNREPQTIISTVEDITETKRIDMELRQFSTAIRASNDGIIVGNLDGYITDVNEAVLKMCGNKSKDELVGKQVSDFLAEEDKVKALEDAMAYAENGFGDTHEYTALKRDGSKFPIEATVAFIKEDNGKKVGFVCIVRDITQRKQAEDLMKESKERFSKLAMHSPDTIYLLDLKTEKVMFLNREFFLGYSRDELEQPDSLLTKVHPDDISFVRTNWQQAFHGTAEGQLPIEYRLLDKSKNWVWIQSRITILKSNPQGKPEQILVTLSEITERKKAEEKLKESENLYKSVFDRSLDGFMLLEPIYDKDDSPVDARFLKVNNAFKIQTGIEEVNTLKKTMKEVIPNIETYWFEAYNKVLKSGKTTHFENYQQGTNRYYDTYMFPYSKSVVGILFRDITERKNLEKQLQEKERMAAVGQTAGMVGHDIRNPLQAIVGDVYLLKNYLSALPEMPIKHDVAESLQEIERNVDYINKIVADLQDYSRAITLELKNVNLYTLVTDAFRDFEIPENIYLSLEIDPKINLKTDTTLFTRILTNLVINAIQAMPKGGQLTVAATKKQTKLFFSVGDTGIGIPQEIRPMLFKPMMTTKSKGQGLGLAVVKRLVEALKGTIHFESEIGKGTKFIIELPNAK